MDDEPLITRWNSQQRIHDGKEAKDESITWHSGWPTLSGYAPLNFAVAAAAA